MKPSAEPAVKRTLSVPKSALPPSPFKKWDSLKKKAPSSKTK